MQAGVIPATLLAPTAPALVGTTLGTDRVTVDGIPVTMPGLRGTHLAQIPVKQDRPAEISDSDVPRELMQDMMVEVAFLLGQ